MSRGMNVPNIHVRPSGFEMHLADYDAEWIEMLQTLDGHLHVDVGTPSVNHPQNVDD